AGPFDGILGTAASPDLEPAWLDQLAANGLLLVPLDLAPGLAYLVRGTVCDDVFHGRLTRGAYFLPLRGVPVAGFTEPEAPGHDGPELPTRAAPWAGWFSGKNPRLRWPLFVQSLAFFGWLRGLQVHQRAGKTGHAVL